VTCIAADLGDRGGVQKMANEVAARGVRLDGIVVNGGGRRGRRP
jgi:NAD(P)-dependent dehydrogenase (short-subunit alcohol dehydrogenase family)